MTEPQTIAAPPAPELIPEVKRGPKRAWRRTVRDMALIVTSILIAFALNAWWEGLHEARQERQYLAGVRRELLGNQDLLRQMLAAGKQADAAGADLLSHMGPQPSPVSDDSLAALLDYSFRLNALELPMGAIQGLLTSGLSLVSNNDLRNRIAGWPALVALARNDTELVVANREEIIRLLQALTPALELARHTGFLEGYARTRFPITHQRVLTSVEVEGMYGNRAVRIALAGRDVRALLAQADTIISLIDSESPN